MKQVKLILNHLFPRTHGSAYDIGVFLSAFLVPWIFSSFGNSLRTLSESSMVVHGWMLLIALVLQVGAAWFKCMPLRTRLDITDSNQASQNMIGWLLALYGLFAFFISVSIVTQLTDWDALPGILTSFGLAGFTTFVMGYVLLGDYEDLDFTFKVSPKQEYIIDLILMIAAVLFAYTIWYPMTDEIMSGQGHIRREASGSIAGTISYGIVMLIPFGMFFIAPRILFIVEDLRDRSTWIRFLIIYLFAAWRMFFG